MCVNENLKEPWYYGVSCEYIWDKFITTKIYFGFRDIAKWTVKESDKILKILNKY